MYPNGVRQTGPIGSRRQASEIWRCNTNGDKRCVRLRVQRCRAFRQRLSLPVRTTAIRDVEAGQSAFSTGELKSAPMVELMTNAQHEPLSNFPTLRTRHIDRVRAAMTEFCAEPEIEPDDRDEQVNAVVNNCQLRDMSVCYSSFDAALHWKLPEAAQIVQFFPVAGAGQAAIRGASIPMTLDRSVVIPVAVDYKVSFRRDYRHLVLHLNPDAVTRKLSAIIGTPVRPGLALEPEQDLSMPAAQHLRALLLFLVDQLNTVEAQPSDLASVEMEQSLIVAFLCGNRHNYSALLDEGPARTAPRTVRRAEEFIEANWNKPITVEDLAAVAGTSARSLFRTFRHSRGCSPMVFAKQVRLRRAQQMLQSTDQPLTVAQVASVCGFADVGHFSSEYYRSFGELPSKTLSRTGAPRGAEQQRA